MESVLTKEEVDERLVHINKLAYHMIKQGSLTTFHQRTNYEAFFANTRDGIIRPIIMEHLLIEQGGQFKIIEHQGTTAILASEVFLNRTEAVEFLHRHYKELSEKNF